MRFAPLDPFSFDYLLLLFFPVLLHLLRNSARNNVLSAIEDSAELELQLLTSPRDRVKLARKQIGSVGQVTRARIDSRQIDS